MLTFVNLFSAAMKLVGFLKPDKSDETKPTPKPLDGKKTYVAAAALVLYGICGAYCGFHTADAAVVIVLNGLGLASLRDAVEKLLPRLMEMFVVDDPKGPTLTVDELEN